MVGWHIVDVREQMSVLYAFDFVRCGLMRFLPSCLCEPDPKVIMIQAELDLIAPGVIPAVVVAADRLVQVNRHHHPVFAGCRHERFCQAKGTLPWFSADLEGAAIG